MDAQFWFLGKRTPDCADAARHLEKARAPELTGRKYLSKIPWGGMESGRKSAANLGVLYLPDDLRYDASHGGQGGEPG